MGSSAVTKSKTLSLLGSKSVKGPGQNFAIKRSISGRSFSSITATLSSQASSGKCTISGSKRGRFFVSKIFTTAGYRKSLQASIAQLPPDLSPKHTANLDVEATLDPPQPIAGKKTIMFFRLQPADGIEPYLGAWGHMLVVSNDLLDLIHTHPSWVTNPDGSKQIQFDLFFPREATYRVWVQFQRNNQVNTAAFTIPVTALK